MTGLQQMSWCYAMAIGLVSVNACSCSKPARESDGTVTRSATGEPSDAGTLRPNDVDKLADEMGRQLPEAELVFVGEIVAISKSPEIWSGLAATYQEVTYRVTAVLLGTGASVGDRVVVRHLLVDGSPTADRAAVQLLPSLFHTGSSLVVLVRLGHVPPGPKADYWNCVSEQHGVAAATASLVEALERRINKVAP